YINGESYLFLKLFFIFQTRNDALRLTQNNTDMAYAEKFYGLFFFCILSIDSTLSMKTYRWMQDMIFTVEEINKDPELLPNITLGYAIYDTCYNIPKTVENAFALVSGKETFTPNYQCKLNSTLAAVVGGSISTISIAMASVLGLYRYPQISYFSSAPILSNKQQFPSFFRTMPSDIFQSRAFVIIVKQFGWKWVGVLADDIDYGLQAVQIFIKEAKNLGVCIAFSEKIPITYSREKYLQIVDTIKASSAKVIVAFSCDRNIAPLLDEIVQQNVTDRTWLASVGWSTSGPLFIIRKKYIKHWTGTIGITLPLCNIEGLQEFLFQLHPLRRTHDIHLPELWEEMFDCSWTSFLEQEKKRELNQVKSNTFNTTSRKPCTGLENMREANHIFTDVTNLRTSCNVHNAVYSVAYALHDLQSCVDGKGPFENGTCANIHNFEPWQVRFMDKSKNEQRFDEDGDVAAIYDVINWQETADGVINFVKIGHYDSRKAPGHQLTIGDQEIIWNNGDLEVPQSVCSEACLPGTRRIVQQGQPRCCFDCVPCAEGNISNGTECTQCPEDSWSNQKKDECLPKEIEFLSFEEPLGIILTVFSLLGAVITVVIIVIFIKFLNTPIVRANNHELSFLLLFSLFFCFLCCLTFIGEPSVEFCVLQQTGFGISFALCISCILVKTSVVVLAFKMTAPNQNMSKYFRPIHHRIVVTAITLVQIGISLGFLISSPLVVQRNSQAVIGKIILECNKEPELALIGILGYIGTLALLCFILAFLARKLPNNFNEAKFISFSLLVFFVVWLSFIPAHASSKGKYLVAVEIFAILSSTFGLLAFIFFPKCYVVLMRPDLNTKQGMMGRAPPQISIQKIKHEKALYQMQGLLLDDTGASTHPNPLSLTSLLPSLSCMCQIHE
uniref:G-protein coupled receptors family 3 profile domain-containing protein n=1 Tax=Callorhinchus milii TaxID=7868 RepID=A0A4W3GBY7_CALMI